MYRGLVRSDTINYNTGVEPEATTMGGPNSSLPDFYTH